MKKSVIHGRFQLLHLDHIKYLMEGFKRSDYMTIGITNFEPIAGVTGGNDKLAQMSHFKRESNPFTYYERMQMIMRSLKGEGVPQEMYDITPFPIEFPERINNYAPKNATYLMTIDDEWGREKLKRLQGLGLKTEVMWERTHADRFTSGTVVRELIAGNKPWEHLVPAEVYKYVIENKLDERIRQIAQQSKNY